MTMPNRASSCPSSWNSPNKNGPHDEHDEHDDVPPHFSNWDMRVTDEAETYSAGLGQSVRQESVGVNPQLTSVLINELMDPVSGEAVTASEADTIRTASVTVTTRMLCRCDAIFTIRDESGGYFYQRWYDVQAWEDEAGRWWAQPEGLRFEDGPWPVYVRWCGSCHQRYAMYGGIRVWRCQACERERRTRKQRARRAQRRCVSTSCEHCGVAPLQAHRRSRRYCSARCRVAAYRSRVATRQVCPAI
jgi:hypothetical protein